MTTLDDLPAAALRLITRFARTRSIPGTNRFAQISRSWHEAGLYSDNQEQLQLQLALEGLPADTVTSTTSWISQHGACVTSLNITYNRDTAPLFQQLPLSTAPLVGLVRLEVDGPDSLVALAPVLPQLVALTHLRASIGLVRKDHSYEPVAQGVFSACRSPLQEVPCLRQLCPGLKSLHLDIGLWHRQFIKQRLEVPMEQLLLPTGMEQLHISAHIWVVLPCVALTSLTPLRRLTLASGVTLLDPDLLLTMPGLEEVDLCGPACCVGGQSYYVDQWVTSGVCTAPQHLNKLAGFYLAQMDGTPEALSTWLPIYELPNLRKLDVGVVMPGATNWLHQLSGFASLRQLSLHLAFDTSDAASLSSLSSVTQLTYLRLSTGRRVPRSTWAAMLPSLRVLAVGMRRLEEDLVAEVAGATQLQCLYVQGLACDWDPAVAGAQVAPHLQVLSKCSSLRAVLCWASQPGAGVGLWVSAREGRPHLSCWHKWRHAAEQGLVVCPRPCPHLPGVWELQQEPAGVQ
jgi:hypothetical protein